MPAVGLTPAGTVIAEDIRDLEIWSSHGRRLWRRRLLLVSPRRPAARFAQASSGLSIPAIIPIAT